MIEEIRPPVLRTLHGLIMPPVLDLFWVAAKQDPGDADAPPFGRSRIHRWRQQVVLERVEKGRSFVVQHTRYQPSDAVHQHGRRQLTPAEDIVPDGYFLR